MSQGANDFNTPQAIAVLFDLGREINVILTSSKATNTNLKKAEQLFSELGENILGIIPNQEILQQHNASLEGDLLNLTLIQFSLVTAFENFIQ